MADYKLSNAAKEDMIRIHQFGMYKFGETQAHSYIDSIFQHFKMITQRPTAFEAVDHIKVGYRRCVCGSDSIFYRVEHDVVEVMAIIGKQDLNRVFR